MDSRTTPAGTGGASRINRGRTQPATIRDVARLAGLSVATVSRTLKGEIHVQHETKARVLEAAAALSYTPNFAARSLSTARTQAIGVVLPDLHGEFFSELLRGMDQAASERGYLLLLSTMHADRELARQAMAAMRGRVDGLIVMAPQLAPDELASVMPAGLPLVLVNSPAAGGHHALRVDNLRGAEAVVSHFLSRGRRHIVHLAGISSNLDGAERRQGYMTAMSRLAPDAPTRILEGDFGEESGERLTRQLLASADPVDAIFAANDMMALGALQALRAARAFDRRTVAVAGFDDIPLARFLDLTTVRVDMAGLGARAVVRLADEIESRAGPSRVDLVIPELIVRATSA